MKTTLIVKAFEKELNLTDAGFKELEEKKSGLIFDASTDQGFKDLRKERTGQNAILKDIDRLAIDGKNDIDKVRSTLKDRVIKIFLPSVKAFEEEDIKRKAAAKLKAEQEELRIKSIKDEINGIRLFALNTHSKKAAEISDIIEAVDMIDISESFAELTQEAMAVKKEVLGELNLALSTAIQNEQIDADRLKLEEQRKEQERNQTIADLKFKAQERLNNLIMIPSKMFSKNAGEVNKKINSIKLQKINESEFGELFTQALNSIKTVISQLTEMYESKKATEKVEFDNLKAEMKKAEDEAAENRAKCGAIVSSWQDAFNSIKITVLVDFVQAKFDWISSSGCDKNIFGDNFDEALDIYNNCYSGISARLDFLKSEKIENENEEDEKIRLSHLDHRIAKDKRDQFQEDIVDGKYKGGGDAIGNAAVNNEGSAKSIEERLSDRFSEPEVKTVREFLADYCKSEGYGTEEESLIEALTKGNRVWSDPNMDEHRWYICNEVVNEINGTFIKYTDYIITGDNGMADMDLQYDLSSAKIVQKKERTVIETYYE